MVLNSLCKESPLKCKGPHLTGARAETSEQEAWSEWAAVWLPVSPRLSSSLEFSLHLSCLLPRPDQVHIPRFLLVLAGIKPSVCSL